MFFKKKKPGVTCLCAPFFQFVLNQSDLSKVRLGFLCSIPPSSLSCPLRPHAVHPPSISLSLSPLSPFLPGIADLMKPSGQQTCSYACLSFCCLYVDRSFYFKAVSFSSNELGLWPEASRLVFLIFLTFTLKPQSSSDRTHCEEVKPWDVCLQTQQPPVRLVK